MTRSNRGATSLKRRRREQSGMQAFDSLPSELRMWLSTAKLPWRPGSVRTTYAKALARTDSVGQALEELDRIESRLVAKDASKIWGAAHPDASTEVTLVSG